MKVFRLLWVRRDEHAVSIFDRQIQVGYDSVRIQPSENLLSSNMHLMVISVMGLWTLIRR